MKLDLSTLPIEFINGIDKVKITDNFDVGDDCGTNGSVYIHKYENGYVVVCGGTYMDRTGSFELYPLSENKAKKFYKERTFKTIEEAWNTFMEYHKL